MPKTKLKMTAGEWMREQGRLWEKPKHAPSGKHAKKSGSGHIRQKRAFNESGWRGRKEVRARSIGEFVEDHRDFSSGECLFVPAAKAGAPAVVEFCGKQISAARYMLLLTQGAPGWQGAYATHKCGNGHLSCVNPKHLKWGDPSTNVSDAVAHRNCDTIEEKIEAVDRIDL